MTSQNNGETQVKLLTDVCQNVCDFIKTITSDNLSKDEKINSFKTKTDDLQCLYSDLKIHLSQINELVKKLANMLNFNTNQHDSTVEILTQWISSLSNKKNVSCKKRKLYSSYSPLKLSLKEKTEVTEDTENKLKFSNIETENKTFQNEIKNIWKLPIKRDGNPSDLLKRSKQTILTLQPSKVKMDITTFSSPKPSNSVSTSSNILSVEKTDKSKNRCENYLYNDKLIDDSVDSHDISLSHFNKIIKPKRNVLSIQKINSSKLAKNSTFPGQTELNDQSSDETICYSDISKNILKCTTLCEKSSQISTKNVRDSFDIIPGLNDTHNDLPNYKFKEDPVRKHNDRKLLNGWDCEDCCKFYEANNDNPVEAKTAMNHFSRHRSVKHQHHAPTPPGFWDPI